jgi:hypothetical protein
VESVISEKDSSVALSKEWLENFFNVEVLEIPSVTVSSRATLSFQLLVPFVESEKAKSTSELDKLGLGQYDEQLGSIIGANAIVAEKMDHYYGGWSDLSTFITAGGWLLLLIMIASLFIERFFCRYPCPPGGIYTVLSRFKSQQDNAENVITVKQSVP